MSFETSAFVWEIRNFSHANVESRILNFEFWHILRIQHKQKKTSKRFSDFHSAVSSVWFHTIVWASLNKTYHTESVHFYSGFIRLVHCFSEHTQKFATEIVEIYFDFFLCFFFFGCTETSRRTFSTEFECRREKLTKLSVGGAVCEPLTCL